MANVLGELFGEIASAIREKTGEAGTMKPAQFPEKIGGISTGADVSAVTAEAADVLAGKVFVDAQGNTVEGALTGTIADVSEVTATAEDVLEGKVFVSSAGKKLYGSLAPSSGSGMPAGIYLEQDPAGCPNSYEQVHFELNDIRYALSVAGTGTSNMTKYNVYSYDAVNNKWVTIISSWDLGYTALQYKRPVLCNGKIHFVCKTYHVTFDGTALTKLASGAPANPSDDDSIFSQDNMVKLYAASDSSVYAYDGTAWALEKKLSDSTYVYYYFRETKNSGNDIYVYSSANGNKIYKYENQELVELLTAKLPSSFRFAHDKYFYGSDQKNSVFIVSRIDVSTGEIKEVGYLPRVNANYFKISLLNGQLRFRGSLDGIQLNAILHIVE